MYYCIMHIVYFHCKVSKLQLQFLYVLVIGGKTFISNLKPATRDDMTSSGQMKYHPSYYRDTLNIEYYIIRRYKEHIRKGVI